MKLLRRLFSVLSVLSLLWAMSVPQVARGAEEYTYTVRIYAGQQGTMVGGEGRIVNDGEVLVIEGLTEVDRVSFYNSMVALKDNSKYYVKGIRQSGKGTEEISETGNSKRTASFPVTRDQDYVVAYGVLTAPVQYTVNYQDTSGRELMPSETYYGNVGDRPVVAYRYIEGYQPQAYNLTRTLSSNEAQNVFTFIYTPIPANTVTTTTTTTTTTVVPGPTPATTTSSTATVTAAPSSDTNATDSSSPADEASSAAPPSQPEQDLPDNTGPGTQPESTTPSGPQEEIDLDDPQVPLGDAPDANLDRLKPEAESYWDHIPLPLKIGVGAGLLGAGVAVVWLLLSRKRRKESE